jgi:hypothetical protein
MHDGPNAFPIRHANTGALIGTCERPQARGVATERNERSAAEADRSCVGAVVHLVLGTPVQAQLRDSTPIPLPRRPGRIGDPSVTVRVAAWGGAGGQTEGRRMSSSGRRARPDLR